MTKMQMAEEARKLLQQGDPYAVGYADACRDEAKYWRERIRKTTDKLVWKNGGESSYYCTAIDDVRRELLRREK